MYFPILILWKMRKAINKEMAKVETIAIGREFGRFWANFCGGQRLLLSIHSRGTYFSSAVLRIRNRWIDNLIKGVKSKPPGFRVVFGSFLVLPENICLFVLPVGDMGTLRLHSGYMPMNPMMLYHTLRDMKTPLGFAIFQGLKKKKKEEVEHKILK